jgi:hypothetical protein
MPHGKPVVGRARIDGRHASNCDASPAKEDGNAECAAGTPLALQAMTNRHQFRFAGTLGGKLSASTAGNSLGHGDVYRRLSSALTMQAGDGGRKNVAKKKGDPKTALSQAA